MNNYMLATCKKCEQRFAIDLDDQEMMDNHLRTDVEHCPNCSGRQPFNAMYAYLEMMNGEVMLLPLENFKRV